jgi:hypothetical protein
MDKRKQKMLAQKQDKDRKEKEQNPAFKYINYSALPFPSLLREHTLNDYGLIDDKLEKIWVECQIIEEQRDIQTRISLDLQQNTSSLYASDGLRKLSESELKTQYRIADVTAWQSKANIEKTLIDMINFVGVPMGDGKLLLTEEEHNEIAQLVIERVRKSGIRLFNTNKDKLIRKLKGEA